MHKKLSLILTLIVISIMAMTACSNSQEGQVNEKFQEYYNARVQYIGDNSKVIALLDIIGVGEMGEYTIAMKTDKEPYGLTVDYSKLKNARDETKFENMDRIDYAYFALALIENLNEVDVIYNGYKYHLTIEQANELVKGNIKNYGGSSEKVKEFNGILNSAD
ncbi:DUF4825 domain-containing protein [Parasporobacterium paucivorans]|uniref:DUF4825 domain-containing protein n=1 Tax=Parasporobacterium paucivorans DSM 15970 TaxID=1122934 RepID=A0A1M6CWA4_9FIRM|nr:DUF4825 domain-containing protein [Parasporobacterium paucivorans]SHI65355.1 protein of unknown function [Parasporobacterium paucivorans DSM 15970]